MNAREKAQQKKAQAQCDAWAQSHAIGVLVTVRKDDGTILTTTTRSNPWVLFGTPVIMVVGVSGGYSLERVTVVSP